MFEFHRENEAELTVGVRKYEFSVPFGVVEADGARVMRLREKPSLSFFINAGIYLLEPAVVREIPKAQKLDMTDLIEARLNDGAAVCCFPIHEYWTDIGGHQDLLKARKEAGDLVWTEKRIVAKN